MAENKGSVFKSLKRNNSQNWSVVYLPKHLFAPFWDMSLWPLFSEGGPLSKLLASV